MEVDGAPPIGAPRMEVAMQEAPPIAAGRMEVAMQAAPLVVQRRAVAMQAAPPLAARRMEVDAAPPIAAQRMAVDAAPQRMEGAMQAAPPAARRPVRDSGGPLRPRAEPHAMGLPAPWTANASRVRRWQKGTAWGWFGPARWGRSAELPEAEAGSARGRAATPGPRTRAVAHAQGGR
jgi:hypothetical protein